MRNPSLPHRNMYRLGLLGASVSFLFVFVAMAVQSKAQQQVESKAQLVAAAVITKIDARKNVLNVEDGGEGRRDRASGSDRGRRHGPGDEGIGFPGGGSGNGVGFPFPTDRSDRLGNILQYKVFVRNDTVFKDGTTRITLSDLKVGDHVVIKGVHNGSSKDLDATEIQRNPAGR